MPLDGEVIVYQPSAVGVLLLLGRPSAIGPATLVRVDPAGRVHRTPPAQIAAGSVPPRPDLPEAEPLQRHAVPGLAVDDLGRRVFVVAAGEALVAEVDLRSGRVVYHQLREHVSLLGRVRDWLEPPAQAKASEGATRAARWLGNGLSVAGQDEFADGRVQPFGLRLIDTADWTWRTPDPDGDIIAAARARC
jgi:hypothetical protein